MNPSWLAPRGSWAERAAEARSLLSWDTGREWAWAWFAPLLLVVGLTSLVAGGERVPSAGFALLGAFGCWALVTALDARAETRRGWVRAWHLPQFADAMARYRLHPDNAGVVPQGALAAHLVTRPFSTRRRIDLVAAYGGTMSGRSVVALRMVAHTGDIDVADVVLASITRSEPTLDLGSADLTTPWRPVSDPPRFDEIMSLAGAATKVDLGEDLIAWIEASASAFRFEVVPGWLACSRSHVKPTLDSDQVGVWLAALLGFAERWDAGPRRVGAS